MKNKICAMLFWIVFLLFAVSAAKADQLKNNFTAISVRFYETESEETTEGKKGITVKEIEQLAARRKDSLRAVTVWNKEKNVRLKETDLHRERKVSHFLVLGDMQQVMPVDLVSGSFCYGMDEIGCVIDKGTAYALYGTEYAVGNVILFEEKRYEIRGVANTEIPFFMTQGKKKDDIYKNMELSFYKKANSSLAAEELLFSEGLTEQTIVVDGGFFADCSLIVVSLPFWFAVAGIVILIFQNFYYGVKQKNKRQIIAWGLIFTLVGALYGALLYTGLLQNPFLIPERLIPSRWSDFMFWDNVYQEMKELYHQITYMIPYPKEVLMMQELRTILLFSSFNGIFSILFVVFCKLNKKHV